MDFDTYLSTLTWRYASDEMRKIWSEIHKRRIWRRLWVALAEVQAEFGLVADDQVSDLRSNMERIDVQRSQEIEKEIQHDLMAEVKAFAEQCPVGGGVIHLGMTSMDITDNADVLRVLESLALVINRARSILLKLCDLVEKWVDSPVIAFTHLQPAETSTLGYRLACYTQDLLLDWDNLTRLRDSLKGKGLKGAVGTRASYAELVGEENLDKFESRFSEVIGLNFFPVTNQTYPRKQDYDLLCALAGLGATIHKFAFDIRILQSPPFGEISEPFGKKQVGSSAMPFKRNPINAEKLNSLARLLTQFPRVAWDNVAHSLLERTLDDSANRRTILAESFLIVDELLLIADKLVAGLRVNEVAISRNLAFYAPFAATERLLMSLSKQGADRQKMHERLRVHSLRAWEILQFEGSNPLVSFISADPEIQNYMPPNQIIALLESTNYVGDAPKRARKLVRSIRDVVVDSRE